MLTFILFWLQIEDEIAELENDLEQLEMAIRGMIPAGKLAQTRLERRTYRPGMELCRDSAQYGLTDEVNQIDVTKAALLEKQRQCRCVLDRSGAHFSPITLAMVLS
ncbi:hypothetical protein AHF37_09165 [Paragonimus kellicotti]|nr:hypothetical protein AHF37_09165 [Paragonimus kellicotti]